MNWEAIGAIGEILGAAAVVVSLIYLAVQIRANHKEVRLAAMHEISVEFRESISTFADPQMAELFTRVNLQDDTLTDAETLQLWLECSASSGCGRRPTINIEREGWTSTSGIP